MIKANVKVSIRAVTEQKNFNMKYWINTRLTNKEITCNTAACIAGSTAMTPEFKAAGGFLREVLHGHYVISFNNSIQDDAMAEFWEIPIRDAERICTESSFYCINGLPNVTREMALKALNYLLDNGTVRGFQP